MASRLQQLLLLLCCRLIPSAGPRRRRGRVGGEPSALMQCALRGGRRRGVPAHAVASRDDVCCHRVGAWVQLGIPLVWEGVAVADASTRARGRVLYWTSLRWKKWKYPPILFSPWDDAASATVLATVTAREGGGPACRGEGDRVTTLAAPVGDRHGWLGWPMTQQGRSRSQPGAPYRPVRQPPLASWRLPSPLHVLGGAAARSHPVPRGCLARGALSPPEHAARLQHSIGHLTPRRQAVVTHCRGW